MASLPSFAGSGTLKLEPDFRKHFAASLSTDKSSNISYRRSRTFTQFDDQSESARSLDFSMIKDGLRDIETSCYVPLLQECIRRNSLFGALNLHSHIIKTGTHKDVFVMTFLINVYAKCRAMENARKVFICLPRKNVVAWTTLMTGYVHNNQPDLAINVFLEMFEFGSYPTNYTLGSALTACSALNSFELGKQIHAYSIKYQIEHDASVGNSLCSLYAKSANLSCAIETFQKIREKNVISWTIILSACGDNGRAAKGMRFFIDMLVDNVEPNEFTLTSALSMCCTMLSLTVGTQLHCLSIKLGFELDLRMKNSIMYLYLKCGQFKDAQKLFNGMEEMSLVTMNSMIAGYSEMMDLVEDDLSAYHSGTKALNIFSELNDSDFKPDIFTFSSILTVCSKMVALEQGEQIHAQSLKTGHLSDMIVGTALINMYNKCGSIQSARKAFLEMSTRTLISWTSMITAFTQNGQTQQALQLFEDMRRVGIRPNQITFVGVLSACGHAGMVNEALGYFEMMQKDYKMRPVMDHYECLVDMFVRLGQLNEAFDLIKKMDLTPNVFIWSLLTAGCIRQRKKELGLYAAEKVLELQPKDDETYMLLLNIYNSAKRWEVVSKLREAMREKTDWSWISTRDKIYAFRPDDDDKQGYEAEVYELLEELHDKARRLLPLESFDSSTTVHSEKLAAAFALLKLPQLASIRIIKNISMCKGCHNFMKAISSLNAREIIIRDSKRLHKFVNGKCSCADYAALL